MNQSMTKGYEAYRSNNPGASPYMETDYKAGFEDGWKAREKQGLDLRERAAIAAMSAFITKGNTSPEHIAKLAVRHADALIKEINTPQS